MSLSAPTCVGLGLIVFSLFAWGALSADPAVPTMPDPKLTPGAVAETRSEVICAPGFNQRPRVWHDKAGTLAKYGLPESYADLVQDDDLIPRCLGGDNANPANHWPQSCTKWQGARCIVGDAYKKDISDMGSCQDICYILRSQNATKADRVLAAYQQAFARDWHEIKLVPRK
jgi:hypothetical protein